MTKLRSIIKSFNIDDAKTNLSKRVEMAILGESFIIATARKPLAKVEKIEPCLPQCIGYMNGAASVHDEFDSMTIEEIEIGRAHV